MSAATQTFSFLPVCVLLEILLTTWVPSHVDVPTGIFWRVTALRASPADRVADGSHQDNVLGMLLAAPSLPEKTLEVCCYTRSQLISGDGHLCSTVNSQTVHRLFNVLVNIANLMHRLDSTMPATSECYMHAIEVAIQSPQSHCSPDKLTFQDFVVATWTVGLVLSSIRESRALPCAAHPPKAGRWATILNCVSRPGFDVIQAVHDAGSGFIQAMVDPATQSLPNIILFPDQINQLSTLLLSSRKGALSDICSESTAHDRHPTQTKTEIASAFLSLARRYQAADTVPVNSGSRKSCFTTDGIVLLLHYVAASLCANASIYNDIGVVLCGLGSGMLATSIQGQPMTGRDVARLYYERGLHLDSTHPHLLSNFGSLLKDAGDIIHAIGYASLF